MEINEDESKEKLLLVTAAFSQGFGCDDKTFLCDDRSGG